MAANRVTLRVETNSGKVIYAERREKNRDNSSCWLITVPGGEPVIQAPPDLDSFGEVMDALAEPFGGVRQIQQWREHEWGPFKPSRQFGCTRPRSKAG
jgi:hypothetical protein